MELAEAKSKACSLIPASLSKRENIPSLDTVWSGMANVGKSYKISSIMIPISLPLKKFRPHLHVPFGLVQKKFKDFATATAEFIFLTF